MASNPLVHLLLVPPPGDPIGLLAPEGKARPPRARRVNMDGNDLATGYIGRIETWRLVESGKGEALVLYWRDVAFPLSAARVARCLLAAGKDVSPLAGLAGLLSPLGGHALALARLAERDLGCTVILLEGNRVDTITVS